MRRVILGLVGFLLCFSPLWSQRVVSKLDLSEVDETLVFDVNSIPVSQNVTETNNRIVAQNNTRSIDLNLAPGIVFHPTEERAFLSFPGSNKILDFNPITFETFNVITVGENPVRMTLSPDGTKLVVPCLLLERNIPVVENELRSEEVGQLALVDIETLEVEILELERTLFSLVSNVVFSQDGKTGFVTSTGTDELIRFDVETMTEITPRVKFEPGSRPTALVPAPDRSFLTTVLVGSTNLSRFDFPDAIAVVDPVSFEWTGTLAPETGPETDDAILHDFTASTQLTFSPDGKWALIPDQQISNGSSVPELASDRAWLLDVETGDFESFEVGGMAAGTFYAPTGEFMVVSALDLTFIDPEEKTRRTVTPLRSQFRPWTHPAFSSDGMMYIGAPMRDSVIVHNLRTGEFPRFVEVGGVVERTSVEGNTVEFTSAPMYLTWTPDESRLLVVNYNANTIEQIERTDRLIVPRTLSTEDFFTGVAFTNAGAEEAGVIITGFRNGGSLYEDDPDTEDVVEFVNPLEISIPSLTQFAETADEIMSSSEVGQVEGWFDVDTDGGDLKSFFLIGDLTSTRLDGAVAVESTTQRSFLPEIRVFDGMTTFMTLLNTNRQTSSFAFTLYDSEGDVVDSDSRAVPSRSLFTGQLRDIDPDDGQEVGLFPEEVWEEFEDGYIVVTTDRGGVVAFERYQDDERMSFLTGLAAELPEELPTRYFLPQVALFQGNDTILKLINTVEKPVAEEEGEEPELPDPVIATVTFRDGLGAPLASPVELELQAGQSLRLSVAELFGLEDPGEVVSGWVEVETDRPGLIGVAEIQLFDGKAMSTVPLQSVARGEMVFSHVADGLGLSTGLALINPGLEQATVDVEVFFSDGTLNRSVTFALAPGARRAGLLSENFFEDLEDQVGGFIRVRSDVELIGLELFFADNLELLSAVLPQ